MKIKPAKPELFPNGHCQIRLKKSEVDISDIKAFAQKMGFIEQTSRHITIIGDQTEDKINSMLGQLGSKQEKEKLLSKIEKIIGQFDWSFSPHHEVYHIKKQGAFGQGSRMIENRESIVRLVNMPGMKRFYTKLNKLFSTNLPVQLPHITLFTKGDRPDARWRGIGIPSTNEFRKLNPEKIEIK